jgi:hypothetical protein
VSVQTSLETARSNYATQLEELSDPTKRRPNYTIAGRSVQWQAYQEFLLKQIKELDSLVAQESADAGDLTFTSIG